MFIIRNVRRDFLFSILLLMFICSTTLLAQVYNDPNKSGIKDDDMKSMIEKRAADLTSDLQSKVNLTDAQVSAVKSDLIDYMTKVSVIQNSQRAGLKEKTSLDTSSNMDNNSDNSYTLQLKNADTDASTNIEGLITEDQRTKWSGIRDSWWTEVKAVVYNNSMNK